MTFLGKIIIKKRPKTQTATSLLSTVILSTLYSTKVNHISEYCPFKGLLPRPISETYFAF